MKLREVGYKLQYVDVRKDFTGFVVESSLRRNWRLPPRVIVTFGHSMCTKVEKTLMRSAICLSFDLDTRRLMYLRISNASTLRISLAFSILSFPLPSSPRPSQFQFYLHLHH